jgi:hypothetical protein
MMQNDTKQSQAQARPVPKRPNETGSISVQGFVRIFDPKNQQVFVEQRA